MSDTVKSALIVWLLLMLGTAASAWGFSLSTVDPMLSTIAVMVISAIKVGLVMAVFMELRSAPLPWKLAGVTWVVVATGIVISIYLL